VYCPSADDDDVDDFKAGISAMVPDNEKIIQVKVLDEEENSWFELERKLSMIQGRTEAD
jgi:hypothetical protein